MAPLALSGLVLLGLGISMLFQMGLILAVAVLGPALLGGLADTYGLRPALTLLVVVLLLACALVAALARLGGR